MFIKNKYYRWYYQIIDKARRRGKPEGYYEKHHIGPRCIGCKNDCWNVGNLTYKEHYIVHWFLTKFTEGRFLRQMNNAFCYMTKQTKKHTRNIPARWYERARRASSEAKPRLGMKHTEETKRKISEAKKANGHLLGRKKTEEHKLKISRGNKGKIRTEEVKRRIALTLTGRKASEETKQKLRVRKFTDDQRKKISISRKGRKPFLGKNHSEETKMLLMLKSKEVAATRARLSNGRFGV